VSKKNTVEAIITRSKNNMWNVKAEGIKLGQVSNLLKATELLYENGYKSHAFRRGETKSGKPMFHASVLKFNKENE
jgi:hypothetical protein